jgi:hypothetical protein
VVTRRRNVSYVTDKPAVSVYRVYSVSTDDILMWICEAI